MKKYFARDIHYIFSKCLNDDDTTDLAALFDAGTPIDFTTQSGKRPLIVAIENDKSNLVEFLIDRGADINAKTVTGETALMAAIEKGREAVAHWLLDNGADISPIESQNGNNALIIAAREGYVSYVNKMIDRGADLGHRNHAGLTALDIARKRAQSRIAQTIEEEIERRKALTVARIKKLCESGMPMIKNVKSLPRIKLNKRPKL